MHCFNSKCISCSIRIYSLWVNIYYVRGRNYDSKNDNFVIALDYKNSQRSSYAMSIEDTSAELSHNRKFKSFNLDVDSHYDFFKDDPDYGIYIQISNLN